MTDLPGNPTPTVAPDPGPDRGPEPPPLPAESGAGPRSRRDSVGWIALAVLVALLIGGAIGYAAAMPAKNDAADQRDAAQAQVTQIQSDLDAAKAAGTSATAASETCSKAAIDAKDLIDQEENLWEDFGTLVSMVPGSAEEVQLEQHMNTQVDTMADQHDVVVSELAACKVATT